MDRFNGWFVEPIYKLKELPESDGGFFALSLRFSYAKGIIALRQIALLAKETMNHLRLQRQKISGLAWMISRAFGLFTEMEFSIRERQKNTSIRKIK